MAPPTSRGQEWVSSPHRVVSITRTCLNREGALRGQVEGSREGVRLAMTQGEGAGMEMEAPRMGLEIGVKWGDSHLRDPRGDTQRGHGRLRGRVAMEMFLILVRMVLALACLLRRGEVGPQDRCEGGDAGRRTIRAQGSYPLDLRRGSP